MIKREDLSYPVYMDVPMMMGCMASLAEVYAAEKVWKQNDGQAGGIANILQEDTVSLGIVSQLVETSDKSTNGLARTAERAEEKQIIVKQTEASLLTRMRYELHQQKRIILLDECTQEEWDRVSPSSLVEISGEVTRSPINEMTQLAKRFINVMMQSLPVNHSGEIEVANLNPYQLTLLQNMSLFQAIIADLEASPISDMVLHQNRDMSRRTAVLDLSTRILPLQEQELLCSGQVTVIGKATRILGSDEIINLYRRSLLGTATRGILTQLAQSFNATPGISIQLGSAVVEYPAVEIIPIAIYI